jgi:large subunit ribosomal protein L10
MSRGLRDFCFYGDKNRSIMLLKRADKEQLVNEMAESLNKAKTVILVNYQGLKVKEIQELKKNLREQGVGFQVVKNTLFKIALKNNGIGFDESVLDQPVAVVWGLTDEVLPAKITVEFGKTAEKMEIIGGLVNNQFADVNMIKQLAALPGREELYAKLVGTLNAPMSRLVNVLQGNLRGLVYILNQYQARR